MKWSGHQSQEKQCEGSSSAMELRTCSGFRRQTQLTARTGQAQTSAITFQDQQRLCWHIHFLVFDSLLILAGFLFLKDSPCPKVLMLRVARISCSGFSGTMVTPGLATAPRTQENLVSKSYLEGGKKEIKIFDAIQIQSRSQTKLGEPYYPNTGVNHQC